MRSPPLAGLSLLQTRAGPGEPAQTWAVAVGMPVTRHPPHRSVLALLTHTVPTSDMVGVEADIRIRVQDADL